MLLLVVWCTVLGNRYIRARAESERALLASLPGEGMIYRYVSRPEWLSRWFDEGFWPCRRRVIMFGQGPFLPTDTTMQLLADLGAQREVLWLVGGDRMTDAGLALVGPMPNLVALGLDSPFITDAGIACLGPLRHVESAYFAGPGITEAVLTQLDEASGLRGVIFDGTSVALDALAVWQQAHPNVTVEVTSLDDDLDVLP